ncbi:2-dehydropantoate 2-reductase [Lophiostoma macrostomum CBS 122681]|uniref:2-dehydropantoate 2-reductase n=1 Tax=Lophiostoma macrostomum CBS 122681 TaxID=1314788 RepID=A0A6A6TQQ7_9PLEO|nr:2-dehydropantoate 2-reductase [Lophiostoma macrostomum CBS 122681]
MSPPTNPPKPNILLFGAGSVGTIYLYLLSHSCTVTAVCRSNYATVSDHGFTINSSIFGDNIRFKPRVVRDCSEAAAALSPDSGSSYDYIVVCSKAIPGQIPETIRPAVTPGRTAIVLVQNGIGIEQEYRDAFPQNEVVSCVVYLPVSQGAPGVVTHREIERLEVGAYPSSSAPSSSAARRFVDLVKQGGGTAEWFEDVQSKRWIKLVVNAAWNPICALTRSSDVDFMLSSESSAGTDLVRAVMLEIADIATAHGYPIGREEVDFQLSRATARIETNKGVRPSMLQDVEGGRRIEIEAIVGNTVRLGKEKGVKCEKLEMIYLLAKALDCSIGRR